MKSLKILLATMLTIGFLQANAQSDIPKGFRKGTIVLADNSSLSGYIKDNMRSNASLTFVNELGGSKKSYNGSELNSAEIEGVRFLCMNGDFFRVLSQGELYFLQKASDASRKPSYNGAEAIFIKSTEEKRGDYFIYNNKSKELKLVSRKNFNEVTTAIFASHKAALDKAKSTGGDIARLKDAVETYNSSYK